MKRSFRIFLLAAVPVFLAMTIVSAAHAARPKHHHRHHGRKGHTATHHHAGQHSTTRTQ